MSEEKQRDSPDGRLLPVEQREFLDLLFRTVARYGDGDVLRANPIDDHGDLQAIDTFRRLAIKAIARGHKMCCSADRDLAETMAKMVAHVMIGGLDLELEVSSLYTGVLCDTFAHRNHHIVEWGEDSPQYEAILEELRRSGAIGPLADWLRDRLRVNPGPRFSAFVLGAMTDGVSDNLERVRRNAIRIKQLLERHGYVVHAPCARGSSGRPRVEVVEDDLGHIARAVLVIVLQEPPAMGPGALLGEAARSAPAVIFVTEPLTNISPLTAILGDPEPDRADYMSESEMLDSLDAALRRKRPAVEALARERALELADVAAEYREYAETYQYVIGAGVELVVPRIPDFRVRLICTQVESFASATQRELRAICRALNEAVDGLDEPGPNEHGDPVGGLDQPGLDWDQPALFDGYTRHIETLPSDLPPGWERVSPLTTEELRAASTARFAELKLSDEDFDNMLYLARVMRYREALVDATVDRVELSGAAEWVRFWRHDLGRA